MHSVSLVPADTPALLADTARLAGEIWREYFPGIISPEQVEYMVDKFQSLPAMEEQIRSQGYTYYQIRCGEEVLGYTGVCPEADGLFLSKLYLKKEYRGKGYATKALRELTALCREKGYKFIRLTCNKGNTHSLEVYRHWGFVQTDAVKTDIGGGFVMDDYVMTYNLD